MRPVPWDSVSFTLVTAVISRHRHLLLCRPSQAQVRGVYPVGMNATNSGVTPEPGLTYSNLFVFFSRDQLKGPKGETLATGQNSVMMDMNSFVWVSKKQIGIWAAHDFRCRPPCPSPTTRSLRTFRAQSAVAVDLPILTISQLFSVGRRNALTFGQSTGSWRPPADSVPPRITTSVPGYWTHVVSSGQTFYLTRQSHCAVRLPDVRISWHATGHEDSSRPKRSIWTIR